MAAGAGAGAGMLDAGVAASGLQRVLGDGGSSGGGGGSCVPRATASTLRKRVVVGDIIGNKPAS